MSSAMLDLEPKRFWYYFNEICKIPHGSGNEVALSNYIAGLAKKNNLEYRVTDGNNVIVKIPATVKTSAKPVVLQAHLDMVCVAGEGVDFDFVKDSIKPQVKDEWVTATGTSLGADNGIAIAAILTLFESKDIPHGPIEALFTTEEEIGMCGAFKLSSDMLEGRTIVNMDSEEDGVIFIGCAGGRDTHVDLEYKRNKLPADYTGLDVRVSGLVGGHSGLTIHMQKANAIKLMGRVLGAAVRKYDIYLSVFESGTKPNVIPSVAIATIAVRDKDKEGVIKLINSFGQAFKGEFKSTDPDLKLEVKDADISDVIEKAESDKIIYFFDVVPNGAYRMNEDIKGLTQTSINMAIAKAAENSIHMIACSRSSSAPEIETISGSVKSLARLIDAKAWDEKDYPGWQPNINSPILKVAKDAYKEIFNLDARITAVHAGLECGVLSEKFPGSDLVSLGMEIVGAHSAAERVNIKSVQNFLKLFNKVLGDLAK